MILENSGITIREAADTDDPAHAHQLMRLVQI